MLDYFIREATPDDAARVLEMLEQLLDEPYLNLSRATFALTLDEERAFLERMAHSERDAYFIALDASGAAVGNIGMHGEGARTRAHCARLGISVVPTHRSRGVGSRLLDRGISWARERGLRRIELSVHTGNAGAIGLYERFGFNTEGRHRGMFQKNGAFVDAISMALWLQEVEEVK
jgi:RimJ/RimL family protein N-acetyltransferase